MENLCTFSWQKTDALIQSGSSYHSFTNSSNSFCQQQLLLNCTLPSTFPIGTFEFAPLSSLPWTFVICISFWSINLPFKSKWLTKHMGIYLTWVDSTPGVAVHSCSQLLNNLFKEAIKVRLRCSTGVQGRQSWCGTACRCRLAGIDALFLTCVFKDRPS